MRRVTNTLRQIQEFIYRWGLLSVFNLEPIKLLDIKPLDPTIQIATGFSIVLHFCLVTGQHNPGFREGRKQAE